MKAVAVFPASQSVQLIDREPPRLTRPDDVLLQILDVGICGTDKEICSFEYGTPPTGEDHLVIGHEAVAEVVEVGPGVAGLRPGDLVVASVRRPCADPGCRACRSGHQDYCYSGRFTERGITRAHGYLTEYVVEQERYLFAVPRHLRNLAVLAEPLTIAEKAFSLTSAMMHVRPPWLDEGTAPDQYGVGLSALVLGIGPVGLLGAMRLVSAGFTTYLYSRELPSDPRTELAAAIGATYVSSQSLDFAELAEHIGPVDLIYEAVGQARFALDGIRVLGPNGIFVLTGVPGVEELVQADPAGLMRGLVLNNQVLLGTVNAGPDDFAAALHDLDAFRRRWPDAVDRLIADRYPPEQAPELILGRVTGIKTVISFDPSRR